MKIKIFLAILLSAVLSLSFGIITFAQTSTNQATITQLEQQIAALQQQLQQLNAQQGNQSSCYTLNSNLGWAQSGSADIAKLHTDLTSEGISYTPDDINTYSTGTSQAVTQFQKKYGISPQSGYVGAKTRSQLNKLYGCGSTSTMTISILPSTLNLTVGGSPQELTSETMQNGQSVFTSLNWTSSNPSIAKVDSFGLVTPVNLGTTFITASSGSVQSNQITVNVTAYSSTVTTNTNNCKATCVTQSDGTYAVDCSGSTTKCNQGDVCQENYDKSYTYKDGLVQTIQNLSGSQCLTPTSSCTPNWQCTAWNTCYNGQQNRICADVNNCNSPLNEPALNQSCTVCQAGCTGGYAVDCSGNATQCPSGTVCQLTYNTTNTFLNGTLYTTSPVSGAQCVSQPTQ